MNRKAYHTLEFYKIIERLASEAGSAGGRKRCMELTPMQDLAAITSAQQETEDALTRLYRRGGVGFSGTRDVRASLKRLEIGSTLNISGPGEAVCPSERGPGGRSGFPRSTF